MRDRSMLYQGQPTLKCKSNTKFNCGSIEVVHIFKPLHYRKPANNSPLQYRKYTNIFLQVMITRHNTRLHEVLWWQGWAGGCGVCQAGGRPSQAGPAWPGRIMLGRGRQDIQVMMRIRILLIFLSLSWSAGSSQEHTAPSTARSSDQSTARLYNQNRQSLYRYLLYVVLVINNYEYKRQL